MPNTPQQKANYQARLQMRLRRDKIAGLMMAAYIQRLKLYPSPLDGSGVTDLKDIEACSRLAVQAADVLIAELNRTAPRES